MSGGGGDHEGAGRRPSSVFSSLRLGRAELSVLVIYGASLTFTALGAILAARLLGAEEYGRFTTAAAFVTVGTAVASAGHAERAMRVGAGTRAEPGRRVPGAHAVTRSLVRFLPLALLVVFPLGLITRVPVWVIVVVGLPTVALLAGIDALEAYTRGALQRIRDLVPRHVGSPLVFSVGCGLLLLVDSDAGAVWLLVFRLAVTASMLAYFVVLLRIRPRRSTPVELEPLAGFTAAKVLFTVQGQISILVAGLLSVEAAGAYTAAFRSSTPIAAAMIALRFLAGPMVAAGAQEGRLPEVGVAVRRYARLGFLLAVIPSSVAFIWPEVVLGLFGDDFTDAAGALRVLAGVQLLSTLFGPVDMVATMAGHERHVARWMAAAVTLQLGLALPLLAVDELSVTRLAVIDGMGTMTWVVGVWTVCRRRVGITGSAFGSARQASSPAR